MSFQSEIPIIQKVYDFYRELYLAVEKMPKKDKYTLGNTCEQYIINTLEYLLAAGNASKIEKKPLIQQANLKFDALKFFIRMARELKLLDDKKYLAFVSRKRNNHGWRLNFADHVET